MCGDRADLPLARAQRVRRREPLQRRGLGQGARRGPIQGFIAFDRAVAEGDELFDGLRVFDVERADEIALWLPRQAALAFGDAMIRTSAGELRVCPDSWTQPAGGAARLRALLGALTELPVEHVLVAHGPLVLGGGGQSLRAATS